MKRIVFSILLSCFFITGSLTPGLAKSNESTTVNYIDSNTTYSKERFDNTSKSNSKKEVQNTIGVKDSPDGLSVDNIPLKNKLSQIKVEPSSGSTLGACENDDYYIKISGADFGDGMDINSVTICGVEVCQILMQSTNLVVVYPNSGTPGTGDIVITSKSLGKTTIQNGFTYNVPGSNK